MPRRANSVGDTVAKITDTQGGWEYSQAALDLVALYHRTFPRVFQVLNAIPNPPKGEYSRNHFGGEDAVDAIKAWLNQVRADALLARHRALVQATLTRVHCLNALVFGSFRLPRSPWCLSRPTTCARALSPRSRLPRRACFRSKPPPCP